MRRSGNGGHVGCSKMVHTKQPFRLCFTSLQLQQDKHWRVHCVFHCPGQAIAGDSRFVDTPIPLLGAVSFERIDTFLAASFYQRLS